MMNFTAGILHELIIYGVALTEAELASATATLRQKYEIDTLNCALPMPVPTLDCTC